MYHIYIDVELNSILSILNDFYVTLKQYTGKFRFIFIIGVTSVGCVSIVSSFSNLKNLTLRK